MRVVWCGRDVRIAEVGAGLRPARWRWSESAREGRSAARGRQCRQGERGPHRSPEPDFWKGNGGEKVRDMIAPSVTSGHGHRQVPEPGVCRGGSSAAVSGRKAGSSQLSRAAEICACKVGGGAGVRGWGKEWVGRAGCGRRSRVGRGGAGSGWGGHGVIVADVHPKGASKAGQERLGRALGEREKIRSDEAERHGVCASGRTRWGGKFAEAGHPQPPLPPPPPLPQYLATCPPWCITSSGDSASAHTPYSISAPSPPRYLTSSCDEASTTPVAIRS
jgi:hypothetical protein